MADAPFDHSVLDNQLELLLAAPHWYVGFSGGVDSTVLLHLLQRWCESHANAPPLSAIHVNHALQAESDEWQVHCEWVCRLLQVPLVCLRADVRAGSRGLEAAARDARYHLFRTQLQADEVLFLAHHADDQVETFFLRLLRGAGVQGLAGIPEGRPLGCGRLVRPLLQLPRHSLEDYANSHELRCVEDPSNSDTAQDRNFLRMQVLPLLAQRWPGYRQTVARASEHLTAAAGQLAGMVPAPAPLFSSMGDPGIALSHFDAASPQSAALALRHWLQRQGLPPPDQAAVDEFLRQLAQATQQTRPRLHCSAYTLQRYRDGVYLLPGNAGDPRGEALPVTPGEVVDLPASQGRFWLAPATAEGIRLESTDTLELVWRQGGERCRPRGRSGTASLKKLLQEHDVPPWWRERVPLLCLEGELLAVGDLWLCDSSRWTATAGPGEALWHPCWERNITTAFD
jgi:tRNA(Ile)-lysidine synthase